MQPADPSPAERVRSRIAVGKVAKEEIGAELPGQTQREHPNACEPHAGMVVQVAVCRKFAGPGVEAFDAGIAFDRRFITMQHFRVAIERLQQNCNATTVVRPDSRTLFEPALKIGPPEHFLDELDCRARRMMVQDRLEHFLLEYQTMAQVG